MPQMNTLYDLFVDELKDLYSAERQLLKAIPRMMKGTTDEELRAALENHLQQTEGQVERLEEVFEHLEASPRGKKCVAMAGLVEEGEEVLEHDGDPSVLDAAIIGAAQRVEHYEIAAYGTARAHATALGYDDLATLLGETLTEEEEANDLLTKIAEGGINRLAATMEEEDDAAAPVAASSRGKRGNGAAKSRSR